VRGKISEGELPGYPLFEKSKRREVPFKKKQLRSGKMDLVACDKAMVAEGNV
jgi:hypothetical protein